MDERDIIIAGLRAQLELVRHRLVPWPAQELAMAVAKAEAEFGAAQEVEAADDPEEPEETTEEEAPDEDEEPGEDGAEDGDEDEDR